MAAGSGWFSSENIWLLLQKQCREPDNMSKVSVPLQWHFFYRSALLLLFTFSIVSIFAFVYLQ